MQVNATRNEKKKKPLNTLIHQNEKSTLNRGFIEKNWMTNENGNEMVEAFYYKVF